MGLDATVRCRCFEEHRLKPGPLPYEDLYIDDDGYLSSHTLDNAREKFDFRRFDARYGVLEDEFDDWLDNCCKHEDGDFCSEWVSNWGGCAHFESLVEEAGGEDQFPLLSHLLPHVNGGLYPAEKAPATLAELDRFIAIVPHLDPDVMYEGKYWTAERIRHLLVAAIETGNPIRWC